MALYPEEYRDIQIRQQLGRHQNELSFTALYDEIVTAIVESINVDIRDIVADQINSLRPTRMIRYAYAGTNDEPYDATLHMGDDQYETYSLIMNSIIHRHSPGGQRLFFVTGSAGTGKSFILSAVEQEVKR